MADLPADSLGPHLEEKLVSGNPLDGADQQLGETQATFVGPLQRLLRDQTITVIGAVKMCIYT